MSSRLSNVESAIQRREGICGDRRWVVCTLCFPVCTRVLGRLGDEQWRPVLVEQGFTNR